MMLVAEPVTRATAVADWIRSNIVNGAIPPDAALQEVALAKQTGTSRTPVREALRLLERERLVIYSPNRGYVVRRFSVKEIADAFDVRAVLEGLVCRLVAQKGLSPAVREELAGLQGDMEDLLAKTAWGDRESLKQFDLNFQFHAILIREADNNMLAEAIDQMRRLPMIFDGNMRLRDTAQASRLFGPGHSRQSHLDHIEIIDALCAGDADRAEQVMRQHVTRTRDAINRNFAQAFSLA